MVKAKDIKQNKDKEEMIPTVKLIPIKFKDKKGRRYITINLKDTFKFVPEKIIFEKLRGQNNTFVIHAILTEEEIKRVETEANKQSGKKGKGLDKTKKATGKASTKSRKD